MDRCNIHGGRGRCNVITIESAEFWEEWRNRRRAREDFETSLVESTSTAEADVHALDATGITLKDIPFSPSKRSCNNILLCKITEKMTRYS